MICCKKMSKQTKEATDRKKNKDIFQNLLKRELDQGSDKWVKDRKVISRKGQKKIKRKKRYTNERRTRKKRSKEKKGLKKERILKINEN